jgi:hypothetical protein
MRLALVFAILVLTLSARGDVFAVSTTQIVVSSHRYDLVQWHARNFLSKWLHRVVRATPGLGISDTARLAVVERYFQLGQRMNEIEPHIEAASSAGADGKADLALLESELERLRRQRLAIRADVEETIESEVSAAANTFGLATFGPLVFPPVDVRLSEPPKVLVTSPRDRIERLEDVLIDPGVTVAIQERVEDAMMADSDLAALVVDIGGVATYPASIHASGDLRWTLHITAHEWLHHYLFFRPLGRNMFRSHEMQALNETVADLAAQEISQPAYDSLQVRLPGDALPPFGRSLHLTTASPPVDMEFDFNSEMRETRLTLDRMLESGDVDGAEEYMESRREEFVSGGHPIRKLNQAFFAFYGTYAESPASSSPIGGQVRRLRELTPNLGTFVGLVSSVSSYDEFLTLLEDTESGADVR